MEAAARDERRLEAVGCSALFGKIPLWNTDFDSGFLFYLFHEVPHHDYRSRCGHAGGEGVAEGVVGGDAPTD